jgi:lysozyme
MIHRSISEQGIEFIKYFEGFRPTIYRCPGKYFTIGFGHKVLKYEHYFNVALSMDAAEALLKKDLVTSEKAVLKYINASLSNNQFDALVSFTFNLGAGSLQRSSLRQKINYGTYREAAEEFPKWVYASGVRSKGLIKRRKIERLLFLT